MNAAAKNRPVLNWMRSLHLEPVDGALLTPFKPGQYLTFSLRVADSVSGVHGTDRTITRCHSLSDCPRPTGYRVTIKRVLPPALRPELPPGANVTPISGAA